MKQSWILSDMKINSLNWIQAILVKRILNDRYKKINQLTKFTNQRVARFNLQDTGHLVYKLP